MVPVSGERLHAASFHGKRVTSWSVFHYYDKIPEKINLKKKIFILAHSF
jgi:hypothetical protein